VDLELGFEAPHGEEEEDDDARRPLHCFDFCFDFFSSLSFARLLWFCWCICSRFLRLRPHVCLRRCNLSTGSHGVSFLDAPG